MSKRVSILFEPIGRMGEVEPGESVLDAANRLGVGLRSECGGGQACGKCRVIIPDQVGVTPIEAPEAKRLIPDEAAKGYRLACSTRILSSARKVTVIVPPESIQRARRFSDADTRRRVHLDPLVKSYSIPGEPSREALMGELQRRHGLTGLRIDETLRIPSGAESITASILDECEVIALAGGDPRRLGLAVDVGTSRITVSLLDLGDGSTLASLSAENPQIAYGENLITRAAYAQRSDENRLKLKGELLREINALIGELTESNGVHRGDILHAVIVGNTVMHHLLLGLDTSRLTRAPFTPIVKIMVELRGAESGLKINPLGAVTLLPNIDAFVGADAVADIISSNLKRRAEPTLLLDIGTNTELMLRAGGETLACSCASGPAFEGEHIEHGLKAVEGAIERVRIRGDDVCYSTVGGVEPVGLCGSGMVDAVAELLRAGMINGVGRFRPTPTPRLILVGNQKKFVIASATESGTGSPITISEGDINEILLAKAAISAAAEVLMSMKCVSAGDLKRVLVAGAFGGHLNKANAKAIGLLPAVETRRIIPLGNSALTGAAMAVKSKKIMRQATTIAEETRYVELASNPDFDAGFRKALRLPAAT